ncbi:MAG: alpha-amylase, partial [Paramuribaculum sp.]|nr:alpha-amylase [Paramuribaculum sp.]
MVNQKPIIYQLLPRLFSNDCENPVVNGTIEQNGSGKLNHITEDVIKSIAELGVNTIWYTGVIEHAQATDYSEYGILPDNPYIVKGKAGSPYAIKDYYDIDPDIAEDVPNRMKEFEALVERTHRCGLKVAIDFVPNHLARQYHSDAAPDGVVDFGVNDDREMFFSPSNNFYYITRQQFAPQFDCGSGSEAYIEFPAKASGNDCFTAFPGRNDWYETVKLNYGVDYGNGSHHFDPIPPTWIMMRDILLFWASKKIDYLRCDMVHMVPLEFWHWAIAQVKEQYPELKFIAEIYEPALYRPYINYGGFDYLYDKVGLYDTLRAIQTSDTSAATITNCWQTVEGISDKMLHFLENHDEQ